MVILFIFFMQPIDGHVQTEKPELYSLAQIKKMMRYHGALVAKYDGTHWRFLSGNYWLKLDNAKAIEYAKAGSLKDAQS